MSTRHWITLAILTVLQLVCLAVVLCRSTSGPINASPLILDTIAVIITLIDSGIISILFLSIVLFAFHPSHQADEFRRAFHGSVQRSVWLSRAATFVANYGRQMSLALVFVIVTLVASLILLFLWFQHVGTEFRPELLKSTGILFAIVTACISLTGFMITIRKVKESHNLVTNYQQLLDLATRRIQGARELWLLGVTPLHGNVSQRDSRIFQKYRESLRRARDGDGTKTCTLRILCYKGEAWNEEANAKAPLQRYYEELEPAAVRRIAHEEAWLFLRAIRELVGAARTKVAEGLEPGCTDSLLEVVPDQGHALPSYRALVTDQSAIIYLPIDIRPTAEHDSQHHFEMIGFETNVDYVVEWIKHQFDLLWQEFSRLPGSRSSVLNLAAQPDEVDANE